MQLLMYSSFAQEKNIDQDLIRSYKFKDKNFKFEKIFKCGNALVKIKKPYWFKFD